jgi:putative glutamine amidotransferase
VTSPRTRAPIIAVTATVETIGHSPRVRVNAAYTNAIHAAGLIPLIVPPIASDGFADGVLEAVDGLVLTGGEDVDPQLFGATRHAATDAANAPRDQCEIALALGARARGMPTLAICRGAQVMNVACGGTLVQDIPTERPGSLVHNRDGDRNARVHAVDLDADRTLAHVLRECRVQTNSFHHQSVDRVGAGLRVTARALDGIVEGIESSDASWWMLGVQWHPEELMATPEEWDRALFAGFAAAVRAWRRADVRLGSDQLDQRHLASSFT